MLGFDRDLQVFNLNDTAEVYATLTDVATNQPLIKSQLTGVQFTIQKPDLVKITDIGTVLDDGRGFLRFSETDQQGQYASIAQFYLTSGEIRSVRCDFSVQDPFDNPTPASTDILVERVWQKIEDCFDSEVGGPWLRDQTLAFFTKDKVPEFLDEGLMDINLYHPPTDLALTDFLMQRPDGTYQNLPLCVEAVFLSVVRHLMRSYVEQPAVTGANVVYDDRREYLARWTQIYEMEYQLFDHWAKLFKRQYLGLGTSKLLISNKAGRLIPAPMRSWGAGRGYW